MKMLRIQNLELQFNRMWQKLEPLNLRYASEIAAKIVAQIVAKTAAAAEIAVKFVAAQIALQKWNTCLLMF